MKSYINILRKVLLFGTPKQGRNGLILSKFNVQFNFDMNDGFPLLTTKKMPFHSIVAEFLWILSGEKKITELKKHTSIWNAFADDNDEVESAYGYYIRNYPTTDKHMAIDQLAIIINELKINPNSRRLVMTSWFPENALVSNLPPCHFAYVFNFDGRLNLHITQRSADLALGLPFDIAVFALMLLTVSKLTNLTPGILSFSIVDAHIYQSHIDDVYKQLDRKPYPLPTVELIDVTDINNLSFNNFVLRNYQSHDKIKFNLEV